MLISGLLLAALPAIGFPGGPSLAGTAWQLISIQSMDDAQSAPIVNDPRRWCTEGKQLMLAEWGDMRLMLSGLAAAALGVILL